MSSDVVNTLPGIPVPVLSGVIGSVPVTTPAVPGLRAIHNVTSIPGSSVLLVRNFNSEVSLSGGTDASMNLCQLPKFLLGNLKVKERKSLCWII